MGGSTFEYLVVSLLSCAAMGAIMSSADSLIMGVSNCFCIDIYRNIIKPDADAKLTVRVGQIVSIFMVVVSLFFAMNINGSSFTAWLGVQNGILFQAAPAVAFGLYSDVPGKAILAGIIVGYLVLIPMQYLAIFGAPATAFFLSVVFNAPTLAAIANFATVRVVANMSGDGGESVESAYAATLAERFDSDSKLTVENERSPDFLHYSMASAPWARRPYAYLGSRHFLHGFCVRHRELPHAVVVEAR